MLAERKEELIGRVGIVDGAGHNENGVALVDRKSDLHIEEEGGEINFPESVKYDKTFYHFRKETNPDILAFFLKKHGFSFSDKITKIKAGDLVICKRSAWSLIPRSYKGTEYQILSAINESEGCKFITSGATMINHETGEVKKMKDGGEAEQKEIRGEYQKGFEDLYAPDVIVLPLSASIEDVIKEYDKHSGRGAELKFKIGDRNLIAKRKYTWSGRVAKTHYLHIDWVDDFNKQHPVVYKSWYETGKGLRETTYPAIRRLTQQKKYGGATKSKNPIRKTDGGDLPDSEKSRIFIPTKITKDELQSIISGTRKVANGDTIQATLTYIRREEGANSINRRAKPEREKERLIEFIDKNNLWYVGELNPDDSLGRGTEQIVYKDPNDKDFILKTNNLSNYHSWSDYLVNLLLNNTFFPSTSYELIGFKNEHENVLPVVRQHFVPLPVLADLKDVQLYLFNRGFRRVHPLVNAYRNWDLGIMLGDLHDRNVLMKDDALFFIDTKFFISHNVEYVYGKGGNV